MQQQSILLESAQSIKSHRGGRGYYDRTLQVFFYIFFAYGKAIRLSLFVGAILLTLFFSLFIRFQPKWNQHQYHLLKVTDDSFAISQIWRHWLKAMKKIGHVKYCYSL